MDPAALAFRQRPEHRRRRVAPGHRPSPRPTSTAGRSPWPTAARCPSTGWSRPRASPPAGWTSTRRCPGGTPSAPPRTPHALHQALRPGARVVIIGAGFIGCEVAATAVGARVLRHRGGAVRRARWSGRSGSSSGRRSGGGTRSTASRSASAGTVVAVEGDEEPARPPSCWTTARACPRTSSSRPSARSPTPAGWRARGWTSATASCATSTCTRSVGRPGARTWSPSVTSRASPSRCRGRCTASSTGRCRPTWPATPRAAWSPASGDPPVDGPPFYPVPSFWSDQYGVRIQSFGLPALGLGDVRVLEGDLRSEASSATTRTACWSGSCCSAWASGWSPTGSDWWRRRKPAGGAR